MDTFQKPLSEYTYPSLHTSFEWKAFLAIYKNKMTQRIESENSRKVSFFNKVVAHDAIFDAVMSKCILLSSLNHISPAQLMNSIISLFEEKSKISKSDDNFTFQYLVEFEEQDAAALSEYCIHSGKSMQEAIVYFLRKSGVLPSKPDSGI